MGMLGVCRAWGPAFQHSSFLQCIYTCIQHILCIWYRMQKRMHCACQQHKAALCSTYV